MEHRSVLPLFAIVGLAALFSLPVRLAAAGAPLPGTIITIAGNGQAGFSGDDGPATQAQLDGPFGLAFDAAGNLFIAELGNHVVRRISPAGIITTIAGSGDEGFSGDDGPATSAGMRPIGVTVDSDNNLYIADSFNRRVRKVSPAGIITTYAGSGPIFPDPGGFAGDGGPADRALLKFTSGVAIDARGNLFIADNGNNRVRMVTPARTISTVAGVGGPNGFSGDGGPAVAAQLDPWGLVVDNAGRLYIADPDNHRVLLMGLDGKINTVAGGGNPADGVGDDGLATQARLDTPAQLALDGAGNLFIADSGGQRIRRVGPVGIISTVAGTGQTGFSPDGTPAKQARLNGPYGLAFDKSGNLYFSEVGSVTVMDGGTSFPGVGAVPLIREVVGIGVPR